MSLRFLLRTASFKKQSKQRTGNSVIFSGALVFCVGLVTIMELSQQRSIFFFAELYIGS